MSNLESKYTDIKSKGQDMLKKWIFDLVAACIVAASFLLEFGELSPNEFNLWEWIADTLVFFFCAMSLSSVYYSKGTYKAEGLDAYKNAVATYSSAATISGERRGLLPEFCREYTDNALKYIQDAILGRACITLDEFYKPRENGKPAIIAMTKREIIGEFGKERAKSVLRAKRVKIRGLTADDLMSDQIVRDPTRLPTRKGMKERFSAQNGAMYLFMGVFIAWFGISLAQDFTIAAFAWFFFQVAMMTGRALAAYLTGYENISSRYKDTLLKKTDILNQFAAWCEKR